MNTCECSNHDYNYGEKDGRMKEQDFANDYNGPNNAVVGNQYRDNCMPTHHIPGQVRKYNNQCAVNGRNIAVDNRNYYNNYYTRYNHYYINETNCVQDYVQDCNIYHYTTQTVYNGCKYVGSTSVVANSGCGNQSYNCCRG